MAWKIHGLHSAEIIDQFRTLGEMACVPARLRLQRLLAHFCSFGEKAYSNDGRLVIPLKRRELAALLGITPEHLSRLLADLALNSILELKEQWIVVRDFKRLQRSAA
jgi:CRP-like cAMP-binding protein